MIHATHYNLLTCNNSCTGEWGDNSSTGEWGDNSSTGEWGDTHLFSVLAYADYESMMIRSGKSGLALALGCVSPPPHREASVVMLFNTRTETGTTDHVLKYCPFTIRSRRDGTSMLSGALFIFIKTICWATKGCGMNFGLNGLDFVVVTNPIPPSIPKETFHLTSVSHSHAISSVSLPMFLISSTVLNDWQPPHFAAAQCLWPILH